MTVAGLYDGITGILFFGVCSAVFAWQLWPNILEMKLRSSEALLEQYPGPVVMRVSTKKLLFLSVVTALFGGVGFKMLMEEPLSPMMQILLWPGTVMFLGAAPLLILTAIAGANLRLGQDDLVINQSWRSLSISWHDTSPFKTVVVPGSPALMVVFDNAATSNIRLAALNVELTGHNSGLSDTYGLSPDDLVSLLNAWRMRALQDRSVIAKTALKPPPIAPQR